MMVRFGLVAAGLSGLILWGCPVDRQAAHSSVCEGGDASTSPIPGPSIGAHGNNSDNPFRALAVHPTDPQVLYVGSEGNGLFRSSDGGTTWTWLRSGLLHCDAYAEIYSIAIDPSNPQRMLIATNMGPGPVESGITSIAGVYRSTDAGATWSQFNRGLPNSDVNSAFIVSGSHFVVGLGAGTSTNSGESVFYPGGIYTAGFSASGWQQANTPAAASQSIYWQILGRASGLIAFGGTPITGTGAGTGVVKSLDGGLTWVAVTAPLAGTAGAYLEASSDLQTIYADLRSGSPGPTFYRSTDGGQTWDNPASFTGPIRIVGSNPLVVLAGDGERIYRTIDGFATTSQVLTAADPANAVMAIETTPSDPSVVYATTKGLQVYRSTDGGQNFTVMANLRTFIDLNS